MHLPAAPTSKDPWCVLVSGCDSGKGETDVFPPVCLFTLGPQALRGSLPADVGAAHPSLSQTCSHLWESSAALLMDQRGHLGIASELMRPPITFICFKEVYPAVTPTFQSSPTSFMSLQEKELIIRKSSPRKTNGRDLRRKITGKCHFSTPVSGPRTPLRKPALPSL